MALPGVRRFRFYNAGDRIQETLLYSSPDGHDIHVLCHYRLDMAAQSISAPIPDSIQIGQAEVHVHFAEDIIKKYGDRGVVLIDANYEPPFKAEEKFDDEGNSLGIRRTEQIDEETDLRTPIARNVEEARAKGETNWRIYVSDIVRRHMEQCEQIRSAGGAPVKAVGFVKRALKIAGMTDPAEAMLIEARKQTSALEEIAKENRELRQRLERLESGQQAAQEANKPMGKGGKAATV